jgi:peptide/nickel transport system substrate-binding protein
LDRQALFHAVDREAMLSASYEGVGEILDAILRLPAFANPEGITAAYPYDPEQAIALLDEAGWLVGTDGVREKDGQRLAFTLTTTSEWEPFVVDVQVLQEYWRAVGVEVELDLVEYTSLAERVAAGDYEVAHLDYYGQMTPDLTNRFACENPNNFPRYCNEEVDALLEEARVELNQERRVELYTEFQNLVLADLPILPQYFVDGYSAISPRVHNPPTMEALANNWFAAEKVWIEQ